MRARAEAAEAAHLAATTHDSLADEESRKLAREQAGALRLCKTDPRAHAPPARAPAGDLLTSAAASSDAVTIPASEINTEVQQGVPEVYARRDCL